MAALKFGIFALLLAVIELSSTTGCAAPAPSGGCTASVTDNLFLSMPGDDLPAAGPLSCGGAVRGPVSLRLARLSTKSGASISVGRGGQIYSILLPGISQDLIPSQRVGSPYVDDVLETVATDVSRREASPRVAAERNNNGQGAAALPGWHMHQAGAYARGQLQGKPPVYSPLLFEHFDGPHDTIETLNLALQAHPIAEAGDRFLVYMRLRLVDDDVFELTQTWVSNAKQDTQSPTILDYFNFPWLILDADAVPVTLVGTSTGVSDASGARFDGGPATVLSNVNWVGAFPRSADANSAGFAVVLPNDGETRLRLGQRRASNLMTDDLSQMAPGKDETISVVAPGLRVSPLQPGEGLSSRVFLVIGSRATVAARAAKYEAQASVRRFSITPSSRPGDLVDLCGADRLRACSPNEPRKLALVRTFCTNCAPVFELQQGQRFVYSTEPFLNAPLGQSLSNPAFTINRIVGWLAPSGTPVPSGYRAAGLDGPSTIIAPARGDAGKFVYFR